MHPRPPVLDVHTPSASFSIVHSLQQETLATLLERLNRKVATAGISNSDDSVGPGWLKYEWNDSIWNLDDESDYSILIWRFTPSSPPARPITPCLFLHPPSQPLPTPPAYQNPSYYAFRRPASSSRSSSNGNRGPEKSLRSTKSKKSGRSKHDPSAMSEDDGVPAHKRAFEQFHSENGVRTVIGTIGPIPGVRMLLKGGYRHVYMSRSFARRHGFIPADAVPGYYGYSGLVSLGAWPLTLGSRTTQHQVYLSEETHFDVILGRAFMEKRYIKTDPLDMTSVVCGDTGEKIDCEVVVLRDGRGGIITIT